MPMTNNEMKTQTLHDLMRMSVKFEEKVNVLNSLDRDSNDSGYSDLHDQLTTFFETIESLRSCVIRSLAIVPKDKYQGAVDWDEVDKEMEESELAASDAENQAKVEVDDRYL